MTQYFPNREKSRQCALWQLSAAREMRLQGADHKFVAKYIAIAMNWGREALGKE